MGEDTHPDAAGVKYAPDWRVHPGEILAELLAERGLSQADLVRATGYTAKHINRVIKGHNRINVHLAVCLEVALEKPSAQFWMNLQTAYDIHHVRQTVTVE